MVLEEVLGICATCKKIRISRDPEMWLSEEMNPNLYNRYIKMYEGKLSHGLCPEDAEKLVADLDKI
jgi:hypothetical protein